MGARRPGERPPPPRVRNTDRNLFGARTGPHVLRMYLCAKRAMRNSRYTAWKTVHIFGAAIGGTAGATCQVFIAYMLWRLVSGLDLLFLGPIDLSLSLFVNIALGKSLACLYVWWAGTHEVMHMNQDNAMLRYKFRAAFEERPVCEKDLPKGSHPRAAMERTEMHNWLVSFVKDTLKRTPFIFDMSCADVRKEQEGSLRGNRYHYVDKDLQMPLVHSNPNPDDVVVMVDSDYLREDLPEILAANVCVLYTFFPETAGGALRDGRFCINADDTVSCRFLGGGNGDCVGGSKIWNWMRDVVSVSDAYGRTVLLLESIRVSPHRFLVMSIPIAWVAHGHWTFTPDGVKPTFPAPEFGRMRYCFKLPASTPGTPKKVIAVQTIEDDGVNIHLSYPGEEFSLTLVRADYLALCNAYALTRTQGISQNLCNPALTKYPADKRVTAERLLHAIMLASEGVVITPEKIHAPSKQGGYLADKFTALREEPPNKPDDVKGQATVLGGTATVDVPGENPGRTICQPLIDENVVHTNNASLEKAIIETRLNEARAHHKPVSRNTRRRYERHMDAFMEQEFGQHKHSLSPLSLDEVNEAMTKPTQQADYNQVVDSLHHRFDNVKAFVKKETASKPSKCPHLIQPVSKEHKVLYSRYTLAAAELLKQKEWYAFGKAPADIAARVHEIAQSARTLLGTDFAQWDGSLDHFMFLLQKRAMKYLFHPAHHEELDKLMEAEVKLNGYLPNGGRFNTETMRLSGTPATALLNSLMCAFVSFAALREAGQERPVLGIYGGDDGINRDIDPDAYKQTCADLNLKVKVESAGDPRAPITFLARTYISPATGPESISDVRRALGKLHLTTAPKNVGRDVVVARKAVALSVSDPTTPLLSELGGLLQRTEPVLYRTLAGRFHDGEATVEEFGWNLGNLSKLGTARAYPAPPLGDEATFGVVAKALEVAPEQLQELVEEVKRTDTLENLSWAKLGAPKWVAQFPTLFEGELYQPGEGRENGRRIDAPAEGVRMRGPRDSPAATSRPEPEKERGSPHSSNVSSFARGFGNNRSCSARVPKNREGPRDRSPPKLHVDNVKQVWRLKAKPK